MPTIDLLSGALSRQASPAAPQRATARGPSDGIGADSLASTGEAPEGEFASKLAEALDSVNQVQLEADGQMTAFVRGDSVAVHQVMAAMTRAELSVQLTTAVAGKAIQAYQDIWRINI